MFAAALTPELIAAFLLSTTIGIFKPLRANGWSVFTVILLVFIRIGEDAPRHVAQQQAEQARHAEQRFQEGAFKDCANQQLVSRIDACNELLARKLSPANRASALINRGLVYYKDNKLDLAIADYTASINIDPKQSIAYANRAAAFATQNNMPAALRDIERALAIDPNNANALNIRCRIGGSGAGRLEDALADCDRSLKLKPRDANLQYVRAFILVKMGRYPDSLKAFDEVLKIDPGHAGALYMRGTVKTGTGDRPGGQADIAAAKAIDPTIEKQFIRKKIEE
jgi:tetratricopeptide (TPR) repeat protein